MILSTLEILKGARNLLSEPTRWTENVFARNGYGQRTGPLDPQATCWCVRGALVKVAGSVANAKEAEWFLMKVNDGKSLSIANDWKGYQFILGLLDVGVHKAAAL